MDNRTTDKLTKYRHLASWLNVAAAYCESYTSLSFLHFEANSDSPAAFSKNLSDLVKRVEDDAGILPGLCAEFARLVKAMEEDALAHGHEVLDKQPQDARVYDVEGELESVD